MDSLLLEDVKEIAFEFGNSHHWGLETRTSGFQFIFVIYYLNPIPLCFLK